MTIHAALALLEEEIQRLGNPDRKTDPTGFFLLRAKSMGRTALRRAIRLNLTTPVDFEKLYKADRGDIKDATDS